MTERIVFKDTLNYKYCGDERELTNLYLSLLDELEILALLIKKRYVLIDDEFREQLFYNYVAYIYRHETVQKIIAEKRKKEINAYRSFEKLYNKWNKR